MILVPSIAGLGKAIQLIKGRFARVCNQSVGRTGKVWQSRYHERTLRNEEALVRATEYVHYNPVADRLALEPKDYPWSSANGRYASDLLEYLGQAEA